MIDLIPRNIQPHFETTHQTKDGSSDIIKGALTCCESHDFEVSAAGEIKHRAFSKMYLFPENDKAAIEARCKKCGQVIPVFDSRSDGYEKCGKKTYARIPMKPVRCRKCQSGMFSVCIQYEYPDRQELDGLEIPEADRAFTWIWVTLRCSKCGAEYTNFVDCETG